MNGTFPRNPSFEVKHPTSPLLFSLQHTGRFLSFLVHTSKLSFSAFVLRRAFKMTPTTSIDLFFSSVLSFTKAQCLLLSSLPNHQLLVKITCI